MKKTLLATALLAATLTLAACQKTQESASETAQSVAESVADATSSAMSQAMAEARRELEQENFKLNGRGAGIPNAEITRDGELIVDGVTVPTTPEQKALLLQYRQQITAIALAGIEAGTQGVDLAGKAVTEAIAGIFSGKSEEVGRRIEAEAEKIAESAKRICDQLPGLLATQDQLAASLPAFAPYARLDQDDVSDCKVDGFHMADAGDSHDHSDGHADSHGDGDAPTAADAEAEAKAAAEARESDSAPAATPEVETPTGEAGGVEQTPQG